MATTETADPRFEALEEMPLAEAIDAMLAGQIAAVNTLQALVPNIAAACTAAADVLWTSGRLVYAGAGTSGRVAVQDGVELGPTYGWPKDRLVFLLAGGMSALADSVEGAEDDALVARDAVSTAKIGAGDVFIGVAASGKTPFTLAALEAARAAGALTIGIANNAGAPLADAADFGLLAETGAEAVAGSTRMQAGTAQKAILNLLSTGIMLRLGRVYRGQMVEMQISNEKLANRARAMVMQLAACSQADAAQALAVANKDIKLAILLAMGWTADEARAALASSGRDLRAILG